MLSYEKVLIHAAQQFYQEPPCALYRGNGHPFPGRMDLQKIWAKGHAVQSGEFTGKQAALEAGMKGFYFGLAAVLLSKYRCHQIAQR